MSKSNASEPKILLFDIETSPRLAFVWGHWETDVLSVEKEWYMLCFSYQWLGEREVHSFSLPNFKNYKKDREDDSALAQKLWELFDEADVLVAHNGYAFDVKKANARFVLHGFKPPAPYKQVDTLIEARKHFNFPSNKLEDLAIFFGIGRKVQTGGKDLWLDVMKGNRKAWRKMVTYCKQDLHLLRDVYLKLRPWMKNHPNYNLLAGTADHCTNCGKQGLIIRGYYNTLGGERQRLQCTACGHYCNKPIKKAGAVVRQI